MNTPGLEFVMHKDATDSLGRNSGNDALSNKLQGQIPAEPLRYRTAYSIRAFAGTFYDMCGYYRGKKEAYGLCLVYRQGRRCDVQEIVVPICRHVSYWQILFGLLPQ